MSVVLFLSGQTMGDSLGAIGRGFAAMFDELGHDLVEVRLGDPSALAMLDKVVRESTIEFALTFVNMGGNLAAKAADGREVNYWNAMGIPLISIFGDTPAYLFDRHVMPSDRAACLYAYPEHLEFRKTLPAVHGILAKAPYGPMDVLSRDQIDFRKKESGRLLFLKNGNDPDALMNEWREGLAPRMFLMIADIAAELVQRMPVDPVNRVDHMVDRYFEDRGIDVSQAHRLRLFFVAQLDDYLRRVKSTLIARVLMDFPVDMFGHNWGHIDFSRGKIRFTAGGDYSGSTPMIRNSLGIIDMSPNTGRAPHERPLRAFGMYTLCLTNEQAFFRENVDHWDDFSFAFDPEALRSRIADVIARPGRYVEIGVAAAESFRQRFPGHRFGEQLIDIAAALRLANGPRPAKLQEYFGWPPNTPL